VANPAHLEKLCEGPIAWNAWREANPNIVPDLSGIQLTLHQRQLGPSNGGPVDLHGADLERAVLRYATLTGADLEGARLVGADLTHARLDNARLMGADLTDALLDQADLMGAMLDQAVLFGADLSDTRNLTLAQLEEAFGDASTRVPGSLLAPEAWFPRTPEEDDESDYAGWGMTPYEEPVEQTLYEVLGLQPNAASDEIRSAYRTLVKKLHPDLNPNDEEAQEAFKRVTTAYRILNDAEQRARYDRGEIDGDGRVNLEFEARRRFRRTAFRYYTAAAASFVLATTVLAAVWYVVIDLRPGEETTPQVSVLSQPKRSERLSGVEDTISKGEKTSAPVTAGEPGVLPDAEAEAAAAEAAGPVGRGLEPRPVEAPKEELAQVPPSAPESPAPEPAAAPPSEPSPEIAIALQSAETPQDQAVNLEPSSAPPEQAQLSAPQQQAPSAEPPRPARTEQPIQTPQVIQPSSPLEEAQRPLQQAHQGAAGQTPSSTPDGWIVAAIQPGGYQAAMGTGPRDHFAKDELPKPAQRPVARDVVSKVLRARAFGQALRARGRPVVAIEGNPSPERRAGLTPEFPTNAAPAKRREPSGVKPKTGSQRKPQQEGRPPLANRTQAALGKESAASMPSTAARGREAPVSLMMLRPAPAPIPMLPAQAQAAGQQPVSVMPAAPLAMEEAGRDMRRQHQAVSDVLSGGL
jgi:hypothetical protein